MEGDARLFQAIVDHLQAVERARIDVVHCRTDEDYVTNFRPLGDFVIEAILQIPRIGEIETLIDPHRQYARTCDHIVALDVAIVLRSRDLTDDRDMRTARAPEI